MSDLVFGIGVNDGKYPTQIGGKAFKEYSLWIDMLYRCTQKYWDKFPTYIGVTCSENFKSYSYFYEWCQKQIGFGNKDENGERWNLDKDILVKGSKLYSEYVCVFVPQRINSLLIKRDTCRGEWPVGVVWDKGAKKFRASCSKGGKRQNLGRFNTPQEAFQAYKTFKETVIKQVAEEYKHQLDVSVYEALTNYEVNEND